MLTDIFANRYADIALWEAFTESERRLLVQAYRIVIEQLFPINKNNNFITEESRRNWQSIHDRLSTELGLQELSKKHLTYPVTWNGNTSTHVYTYTIEDVCKNFMLQDFTGAVPPDRFIKERLSLIELAFRAREETIGFANRRLDSDIADAKKREQEEQANPHRRGLRLPGSRVDGLVASNQNMNARFRSTVAELNERLRQADTDLHYHNGFIQRSTDPLVEAQVETPFWALVSDPEWANVDTDMKEAIDRRDNNDRDPAFYAARALESAIKIISDQKGWTHRGEKGAHSYIDNLSSRKNGCFISPWEADSLKGFFTHVRNPFGHGSGSAPMPVLTPEQTNWAIEFCMIWIKNLILRF